MVVEVDIPVAWNGCQNTKGSDTECRNCPIRISSNNDETGVKKARLGILAYIQWTWSCILHEGHGSI